MSVHWYIQKNPFYAAQMCDVYGLGCFLHFMLFGKETPDEQVRFLQKEKKGLRDTSDLAEIVKSMPEEGKKSGSF